LFYIKSVISSANRNAQARRIATDATVSGGIRYRTDTGNHCGDKAGGLHNRIGYRHEWCQNKQANG
jgi:hypothetical protein